MLKPILCIMIVGASLAVGIYCSSRLTQRVDILTQLIVMLEEAAAKMRYTSEPLAKLFQDNFAEYPFADQQPFNEQFTRMIHSFRDVLKAEDIRLMEDFCRELGTSDTESTLRHIRLYITLLTEQRETARREVIGKGKLYRLLPLSAGIAAAIVLI